MPSPRKKRQQKVASELLSAVEFIKTVQHPSGDPFKVHCRIGNGCITALDGVLAAGMLLNTDIETCPHTYRFAAALAECGDSVSLTMLDNERIAVTSGKFRAVVPCRPMAGFPFVEPDAPAWECDNAVRDALAACAPVVTEGAADLLCASVLLTSRSCVATDRHLMVECWHGHDLPSACIPRSSVNVISKIEKKLVRLGHSADSITFYYEDNSWLKTQTYRYDYPDYGKILNVETHPVPINDELYRAIEKIVKFNDDHRVYFKGDKVSSANDDSAAGASVQIEGIPNNLTLNAHFLLITEGLAKSFDWITSERMVYFFGDKVRGAIACIGDNK